MTDGLTFESYPEAMRPLILVGLLVWFLYVCVDWCVRALDAVRWTLSSADVQ